MDALQDKHLKCRDCNADFTFSVKDQQFYAERNFNEPRRCRPCRLAKKEAMAAKEAAGHKRSGSGRETEERSHA